MATLTIRNLPDAVRDKLRARAAAHGRSMEAEARAVLEAEVDAVSDSAARGDRIAAIQAKVRAALTAANGGVMPTGVVDDWLAEKREIAAAEQARYDAVARRAAP
jgi:plasmid stability protein